MPDNLSQGAFSTATNEIGGVHFQRVKLTHGPAGTAEDASPSTPIPVVGNAFRSVADITRPANVTAYTAGDVVGGVVTFAGAGLVGGHVILSSIDLRYDIAAVPSGMIAFRLHLYGATPPSALADNAPFDLPSGDRSAYLGYVDLGGVLDLGSTLWAQADNVGRHLRLTDANLYGYLQTLGGYTPASGSETLRVVLRSVSP